MGTRIQMACPVGHTSEEAFDLFLRRCKVNNLSEQTIQAYRQKLSHFFRYLGKELPIAEVTSDTVDGYVLWLKDKHRANDITINTYLRHLRAFLYYCMDCGYMPRFKIKLPKAEKKLKETYTQEELERLLEKPDTSTCSFSEFKTWAIECTLAGTGMRISSALNLRNNDIDLENGSILLRKTKNRHQMTIPLSRTLEGILGQFREVRGGEEDDYLFCTDFGEQLKTRAAQQLIRNYNIKRNVNKTSAHLFRATFAKSWVMNGGDPFRLQRILGHSSLAVTKEYINLYAPDLQVDFERYNPLDKTARNREHISMHKKAR